MGSCPEEGKEAAGREVACRAAAGMVEHQAHLAEAYLAAESLQKAAWQSLEEAYY